MQRLPQVEAQRIVDNVHRALRRAITRHELEPGFHLSVPALAEQFGVSRSPVREAVQRLVAEGLAIELPRRGAYVTRYEPQTLLPLYQVRMALEGMVARLAAGHMTPEWTDRIGRVLIAEKTAIDNDDMEKHIEADLQFHELMIQCAGNPVLADMLKTVYGQIRSAITARVVQTGPQFAYQNHVAIFEAASAGNANAAEAAARAHVKRIIRGLTDRPDP